MNAIRSWGADFARRLGIGGVIDFDRTTVGKTLHVPCAVGKHHVDVSVKPDMDPNGTVKHMLNQGWTVGRRRLVCPDCKRKTEQEKEDARAARRAAKVSSEMPPALATALAKVTPEQRREWSRKGGLKLPPEVRRANGRIGGLKAAANRREREAAAQQSQPIPERETKIMPQPEPTTATDKARAAKRDAMDSLSLAFKLASDGKSGTYSDGYSDGRIAKETGLAESAVAQLREDFFGPLGEPGELTAFRSALTVARTDLAAAHASALQRLDSLDRSLRGICQRQGWPVA